MNTSLAICGVALYVLAIASIIVGMALEVTLNPAYGEGEDPLSNVDKMSWIGWGAFGSLLLLGMASAAVYGVLMGRMWSLVQDGRARLAPWAAVVLSVTPLVLYLGVYFAFWGLAKEFNRVAVERDVEGVRVGEGMALAACICLSVSGPTECLPCVGLVVMVATVVLWAIPLIQMARASGRLVGVIGTRHG